MIRSWTRRSLLSLLATAVLAGGCAESGPEPLYAPRLDEVATGYTPVNGSDGDGIAATRTIGAEGGTLTAGGHTLVVPAGAVTAPTVFVMRLTDPGAIAVELTATTPNSAEPNNVGSRGFARPLLLQLGFEKATRNVNPGRLSVAWARADGTLEPMPSSVDMSSKVVTGQLRHFSGYILVD